MINGLGVLGWGVGGIEAEAVMLGQPYYMVLPEVVGVKLGRGVAGRRNGHRSRAIDYGVASGPWCSREIR